MRWRMSDLLVSFRGSWLEGFEEGFEEGLQTTATVIAARAATAQRMVNIVEECMQRKRRVQNKFILLFLLHAELLNCCTQTKGFLKELHGFVHLVLSCSLKVCSPSILCLLPKNGCLTESRLNGIQGRLHVGALQRREKGINSFFL
jgi:hypothetical protein